MELISKQRQPLPELNALYFLSPSEDSVQALIKDFKDEKKPQYRSAYVYFSAYIRKSHLELFSSIAISSSLESNEGPFHAFFHTVSVLFHIPSAFDPLTDLSCRA